MNSAYKAVICVTLPRGIICNSNMLYNPAKSFTLTHLQSKGRHDLNHVANSNWRKHYVRDWRCRGLQSCPRPRIDVHQSIVGEHVDAGGEGRKDHDCPNPEVKTYLNIFSNKIRNSKYTYVTEELTKWWDGGRPKGAATHEDWSRCKRHEHGDRTLWPLARGAHTDTWAPQAWWRQHFLGITSTQFCIH